MALSNRARCRGDHPKPGKCTKPQRRRGDGLEIFQDYKETIS